MSEKIHEALKIPDKLRRQASLDVGLAEAVAHLNTPDHAERFFGTAQKTLTRDIANAFESYEKEIVRKEILDEGTRADGRKPAEIRRIACHVGVLPRTHGSALFIRGETQALAVTTLGTAEDEQKIETLEGDTYKRFMLHYNFPPFSVGEVKPLRSPDRREIGHGALAERALLQVIPSRESFPYTVRVVSDILESNGLLPWRRYAARPFLCWMPECPSRHPSRASPWAQGFAGCHFQVGQVVMRRCNEEITANVQSN